MLETVKTLLKSGAIVTAVLAIPAVGFAQDVNLRSDDGKINLSGALIEHTDEYYIIENKFGPLRVAASAVTCYGDGCPTTEVATAEPAVNPDVVTWDVSLWGKKRAFTLHVERLAELLAEKTDGKFRLNLNYGGLSEPKKNLDGISQGSFEMAQFCAGYHREKNPTLTVLELPFLGVNSLEQEVELSRAVYAHPATKADLARWNATLLMPSPLPQYNIIGTGGIPTSLEAFADLRIRATGGVGQAIAALGADLVSIPATEVRDAMSAGDVDAVSFAPHAHMAFGTIERATWWTTNLNPGTVHCPVVVNTDALQALPFGYRVALESSLGDALDFYVESYNSDTMAAWGPALRDRGITELTFNKDIRASIKEAVATPAAEAWVFQNSADGLPAQELYNLVRDMIAKAEEVNG